VNLRLGPRHDKRLCKSVTALTTALLCLFLCFLAGGQLGCRGDDPRPLIPAAGPNGPAVRIGALPRLDAAAFRAWAAHEKTPVLISLWAQWCAPCLAELPFLDAAAGTYAAQVKIVAVNVDDHDAEATKGVDAALATLRPRMPLAIAADGAAELAAGLGDTWPGVLPYHILIAADGRLLHTYAGPLDALTADGHSQFEVQVLSYLSATEGSQ